jgi:fucose 4-O-acetylase-like acetyltransferase
MIIISIGIYYFKNYSKVKGTSLIEVLTRSLLVPTILFIWLYWTLELLPKEEIEAKKLKNISLNAARLSILVSLVLLVGSTVMLPFTVRKIGAQWSQDQSGITARIEKPKIEVSGLDTAMQGIHTGQH